MKGRREMVRMGNKRTLLGRYFSAIYLLIIFLFINLIFHIPAYAQEQIKISSDELAIEEKSSKAIFSGNVLIVQPNLKMWAKKLIVYYGEDGPSDIESLEAIGDIKIEQPEQTATADRGIYDPKTKILKLFGNVSVTNDSGTITGPELIVDIAKGTSIFPSSQDGERVTAIFSPE